MQTYDQIWQSSGLITIYSYPQSQWHNYEAYQKVFKAEYYMSLAHSYYCRF
jgi:hypothetical protein